MNLGFSLGICYGGEEMSNVVTREDPRNEGEQVCFSLCFVDVNLR